MELEELFESVRTENFRRMMSLSAITTQLRKAFTSINVLKSLELLQTEDLERLASMPLFEERYQRLTNVTFLELIQQIYNYGLTQVCGTQTAVCNQGIQKMAWLSHMQCVLC